MTFLAHLICARICTRKDVCCTLETQTSRHIVAKHLQHILSCTCDVDSKSMREPRFGCGNCTIVGDIFLQKSTNPHWVYYKTSSTSCTFKCKGCFTVSADLLLMHECSRRQHACWSQHPDPRSIWGVKSLNPYPPGRGTHTQRGASNTYSPGPSGYYKPDLLRNARG